MTSERMRQAVFASLCRVLGEAEGEVVMERLDLAERLMLAQEGGAAALRGEMAEVRGEMAEVRGEMGELRGEMGELRGEMRALAATLRAEMANLATELRSEMAVTTAQLGARIDRVVARVMVANFAFTVSIAGIVLAIVRLG